MRTDKFGMEQGSFYFDKACIFIPLLIVLMVVQAITDYIQAQMKGKSTDSKKKENKSTRRVKKGKKD